MRIYKKVQGRYVILDIKKVKKYPHGFTLYNVYKNNVFLYRTCYTDLYLQEIKNKGNIINEEVSDLCM